MDKIRKGSLVIFKNAFGEPTSEDKELMKVFADIFGHFGVVITDIYEDDGAQVVDLWFPKDIKFFAIPISRLKLLNPA